MSDEVSLDDLPELIAFLFYEFPDRCRQQLNDGLTEWEKHQDGSLEKRWRDLLMQQWRYISWLEEQRRIFEAAPIADSKATAIRAALAAGVCYGALVDLMWQAKQLRPQANLKVITTMVQDDEILAVVNDPQYPTRAEQAERLGISERYLKTRLAKIRKRESE